MDPIDFEIRLKSLEVQLGEITQRVSKLERQPGYIPEPPHQNTKEIAGNPESIQFQKSHGALFDIEGRGNKNAVFCEFCEVPLYAEHDEDLLKCPKCGKCVEFSKSELPRLIAALERNGR